MPDPVQHLTLLHLVSQARWIRPEHTGSAQVIICDSPAMLSRRRPEVTSTIVGLASVRWNNYQLHPNDVPEPGQLLIYDANRPASTIPWGPAMADHTPGMSVTPPGVMPEVVSVPVGSVFLDDRSSYSIAPDYEYIPWKQAGWSVSLHAHDFAEDPAQTIIGTEGVFVHVRTEECSALGASKDGRLSSLSAQALNDTTSDLEVSEHFPGIGAFTGCAPVLNFYTEDKHWADVAAQIFQQKKDKFTQASPSDYAQIFAKELFIRQMRSGTRNDTDNR